LDERDISLTQRDKAKMPQSNKTKTTPRNNPLEFLFSIPFSSLDAEILIAIMIEDC